MMGENLSSEKSEKPALGFYLRGIGKNEQVFRNSPLFGKGPEDR